VQPLRRAKSNRPIAVAATAHNQCTVFIVACPKRKAGPHLEGPPDFSRMEGVGRAPEGACPMWNPPPPSLSTSPTALLSSCCALESCSQRQRDSVMHRHGRMPIGGGQQTSRTVGSGGHHACRRTCDPLPVLNGRLDGRPLMAVLDGRCSRSEAAGALAAVPCSPQWHSPGAHLLLPWPGLQQRHPVAARTEAASSGIDRICRGTAEYQGILGNTMEYLIMHHGGRVKPAPPSAPHKNRRCRRAHRCNIKQAPRHTSPLPTPCV
jgi:hypothetical protein